MVERKFPYYDGPRRGCWTSVLHTIGLLSVLSICIAMAPRAVAAADRTALAKAPAKSYENYTIIGAVELVTIYPQNFQIRAKIDTGAKSSSIDAEILKRFSHDGTDWVQFKIFGDEDATHRIESPITRSVRIRRAGTPRDVRSAVTMRICLGTVAADVLVNFAERRELNYRLLLGRDFLKGRFLVDAEPRYLTKPSCNGESVK